MHVVRIPGPLIARLQHVMQNCNTLENGRYGDSFRATLPSGPTSNDHGRVKHGPFHYRSRMPPGKAPSARCLLGSEPLSGSYELTNILTRGEDSGCNSATLPTLPACRLPSRRLSNRGGRLPGAKGDVGFGGETRVYQAGVISQYALSICRRRFLAIRTSGDVFSVVPGDGGPCGLGMISQLTRRVGIGIALSGQMLVVGQIRLSGRGEAAVCFSGGPLRREDLAAA